MSTKHDDNFYFYDAKLALKRFISNRNDNVLKDDGVNTFDQFLLKLDLYDPRVMPAFGEDAIYVIVDEILDHAMTWFSDQGYIVISKEEMRRGFKILYDLIENHDFVKMLGGRFKDVKTFAIMLDKHNNYII